jgi:hypothetical protein
MVKFCCPTTVSLVENVSPGQAGFDQFFGHQQSQSGTHSGMTKISLSLFPIVSVKDAIAMSTSGISFKLDELMISS